MSTGSRVPLHAQVREYLLAEILSGKLPPGAQIPTEAELIDLLGVSRTTVRRALNDLVASGLIYRVAGRGSFVAEPRLEQELDRMAGFVEEMDRLGMSSSAEVVTIDTLSASQVEAAKLDVSLGSKLVFIERVRIGGSQPMSFDVSYLPNDVGSVVASQDLAVRPIYEIMETDCGLDLREAEYVIGAGTAKRRVAEFLQVEEGSPLLLIDRTTFADDGLRPVMYEHLFYRGDVMRYRLRLKR